MGKTSSRRFAFAALLALFALELHAQEPAKKTDETPAPNGEVAAPKPPAIPRFEESPLQILLQPDKAGILVPTPLYSPTEGGDLKQHVLSWTDIDRLLDRSADQQSPRLTCRRVAMEGTVNGDRAKLKIELTFLTSPQRWIRAPLGLSNAVLSEFAAPTGGFLEFDEKDGFVVWMPPASLPPAEAKSEQTAPNGAPNADAAPPAGEAVMPTMPALPMVERTVTVQASLPVNDNGGDKRLSMRIPRSPASRLDLLVDLPEAQVSLFGGETSTNTSAAGTGQTRVLAEGVGGDFAVTWKPKRAASPMAAPLLRAQGFVEVNFEANEQLSASARLTVQSLEPFQTFTVKLPPGMRLSPIPATEYEVSASDPAEGAAAGTRQHVVVRLPQPTIGPVTVRLEAVSTPAAAPGSFTEVGGFEVVEAVEQSGRLTLHAKEDQSVSWVESSNVFQASDAAAAGPGAELVAAQFKYIAQPFSLLVKAAPQKTRVHVEPTYAIETFSDHVKLTAILKYQIHGAKASFVRVDLQGWSLDSVGGDDVVNGDGVKYEQLAPLEIPFRSSVSGDVEVRIAARRILEGPKGALRIPLPAPEADFVVSALVAVAPSDNIEMTPLPEQSHGLLPEPPTPLDEDTLPRQASFFYRTRTGEPQPVFAANYEVKSGALSVESAGEIRLQDQVATVRQVFTYTFAYEPAKRLSLDAPRDPFTRGEMRFHFDGAVVRPQADEQETSERVMLHITPPATLGRHELTVEYPLPLPAIAVQQTVACLLPLATPVLADAAGSAPKLTGNSLVISTARPLHVAPDESEWRPRPAPAENRTPGWEDLTLAADSASGQVALIVTRPKTEEQRGNAIDRLWLQTWLTATQRRDRVVVQWANHADRMRVRLPPAADPESLTVFVNGKAVAQESFFADGGVTTIDLAPFDAPHATVEMWYGFTAAREANGQLQLAAPEFLDASWIRQAYWQLVLPPDEFVALAPRNATSEQVWSARGWWWGRTASLSQADLEEWSGATRQPLVASASEYVYSNFGAIPKLEVQTLHRRTAVLAFSGLILVVGLAALRAPRPRGRRWVADLALVAAVVVLAVVLWAPDAAVLALQCGALGGIGVAAAWFVGRIGARGRAASAGLGLASSVKHELPSRRRVTPVERQSSLGATVSRVPPSSMQ